MGFYLLRGGVLGPELVCGPLWVWSMLGGGSVRLCLLQARVTRARVGLWSMLGLVHVRRGRVGPGPCGTWPFLDSGHHCRARAGGVRVGQACQSRGHSGENRAQD